MTRTAVDVGGTREQELAKQSPRWHAINSAMVGIANAIELCESAELRDLSDLLLLVQRSALRRREEA